ncbi:MAG: pyrroline-5-carboxylate reductase [Hyphomicrobiales bacterium]|jgi:pyrroline-5-carboxylate reductase|nr:pyrroline-5-carboxylate reductase [Hyphomicrobiales bacterium]
MNELKILLIGCGKMGSSLLEGIVKSDNFDGMVDVIEPVIQDSFKEDFKESKVNFYSDIRENKDAINYDLIIIATKPNIYEEIFNGLKNNLIINDETLIVSILAGIRISKIEEIVGSIPIIRAMPNIAASVLEGMTALIGNKKITHEDILNADLIFELIGEKMWLKNEAQMDSFTAISGSGPAYFFFFTECLKNIAIEEGFTEDEANKISQQIIIGSGKLVKDSGIDPKELRENVTSPNGTTEAGLKVLADNKTGLLDKLKQAIMEAKNRSIEISDN